MANNDGLVRDSDLNAVDYLNSSAVVAAKSPVYGLKGGLSKVYGGFNSEWMFIRSMREQAYKYELERFEYEGLPAGLDKYRLELKILTGGSSAVVKVAGEYYACHYTHIDFNMYNEPTKIMINEPKSPLLNGRQFDLYRDDVVIIRNNVDKTTTHAYIMRYLEAMEQILFQLEKNVLRSQPKAIINLKGGMIERTGDEPTDNEAKSGFEEMINSADTFYNAIVDGTGTQLARGVVNFDAFTPIQFDDKSKELIEQFQFFKEQVKEIVGCGKNISEKRERVQAAEITKQQDFATSNLQHAMNIRENDIKLMNEKFGTNVIIKPIPDVRPGDEVTESESMEVQDV